MVWYGMALYYLGQVFYRLYGTMCGGIVWYDIICIMIWYGMEWHCIILVRYFIDCMVLCVVVLHGMALFLSRCGMI